MAVRTEEFAFPLSRDDLIKNLTDSERLISPQEIVKKIHDCQAMFVDFGPSYIEECFPDVLSVIHHFSDLSASIRNLFWNMVLEALNDSCQLLDSRDVNTVVKRSSLKMLVYIVAQFVELFENQESKLVNVGKKTRKSAREGGGGATSSASKFSLWEGQRNRLLVVFYDVIQLNLKQVFVPPTYDGLEDMINIVSGCCFKLLENPACAKDSHFKDSAANLLGLIVKSYHQSLGVSVKMVQLLQHFDHLVQPLAYSVHIMVTKHNLDTFVDDILREIGEKDQQDLSMDTSGTKSYASFIYEVAHLLPFHAKNCIQYLLPHLNGESQTLRCWILSSFGEIISQALNGSDISPEDRELRDVLLSTLQKHIHDVSAFVRSKALQVWQILCEAKSVPLSQLKDLSAIVCGRIKDKSSLVRKYALQLMICLMKTNPFASNLNLNHFQSLLATEKEGLRVLLPENEEDMEVDKDASQEDDEHKEQIVRQMAKVQYCKDAVQFIELIERCIPVATLLLGSKLASDVSESLEFLATAQEFGLDGAKNGVRKALLLMTSSEEAIREIVMKIYIRLYFTFGEDNSQPTAFMDNLLLLVREANVGELASLEEMLCHLLDAKKIPKSLLKDCWSNVSVYSMLVISMVIRVMDEPSDQTVSRFLELGLKNNNLIMGRYSCQGILGCLAAAQKNSNPIRLPSSHALFSVLSDVLISTVDSEQTNHWIPFAQVVVRVIYRMADHPNSITEAIIHQIQSKLSGDVQFTLSSSFFLLLSRFIAFAGEATLQCMVFLENDVKNELLRRKTDREASNKPSNQSVMEDDDIGLTGAAYDELEGEAIRKLCDNEVTGRGILGGVLPIIVTVISKPNRYTSTQLQISASLALAKYMITSSRACEQYLRLFFTILEGSPSPIIRSNGLIAFADLIVRFPNLLEPWTKNVYARLGDGNSDVRQTAVTVLTHLILNDMVKVKGQLSEMVLCLEDPVQKIADKVKLFFSELSRKGNSLYNILPDIISRLSDPSNNISKEKFRSMMSYLINLIHKDKQSEGLTEKFCHRFRASRGELQSQNLAFCLSQLSYGGRGLNKLLDNFTCYQSLLTDDDVYGSFLVIVGKLKKFAKPEVKAIVEEFESKLKEAHEKGKDIATDHPNDANNSPIQDHVMKDTTPVRGAPMDVPMSTPPPTEEGQSHTEQPSDD